MPAIQLKPYHQLHCDTQDIIQAKVIRFLEENTSVMRTRLDKSFSWIPFEHRDLSENVPELLDWFKAHGLILRDIAATVARNTEGAAPHRDQPPVVAKINFPILNTEDTYNLWFDDHNNEIARISMLHPLVFNASMIHAVEIGAKAKLPRVVLSCMFYREPIKWLSIEKS